MDGIEKVPIIRLDHLSDEERRAYMLVHNKLTMNTDFDFSVLSLELDDIMDINMDDFGFTKIGEYIDDFFVEDQEPNERVGDFDEDHRFLVYTHKRGKYDALVTYLKKNEYEYEIDG